MNAGTDNGVHGGTFAVGELTKCYHVSLVAEAATTDRGRDCSGGLIVRESQRSGS